MILSRHAEARATRHGSPSAGMRRAGEAKLMTKRSALLLVAVVAAAPCYGQTRGKQTVLLHSNWEFRQRGGDSAEWHPAQVPGCVHLDLLRNKLIPDPDRKSTRLNSSHRCISYA